MTDQPEPSSAPQSRFRANSGTGGHSPGLWPAWIRWGSLAANGLVTLAFLALVPPILGTLVVGVAYRLAHLPRPPLLRSDLPWLYLIGFLLAPSTLFSFIAVITLIQQTIKATRRK